MKLRMFAVRDKMVEAFMPPFFVRHLGEAVRSFTDACNDASHQFAKHVGDFDMYEVGEFDDQSGIITQGDVKRVMSGLEAKASE